MDRIGGIGRAKHQRGSAFGARRAFESAMMFAQLTLEARRTERALRELLRTVDAARIGVAWSGQPEQDWFDASVDLSAAVQSQTELTGNQLGRRSETRTD